MRTTKFLNCVSFNGNDKENNRTFTYYKLATYIETKNDKQEVTDIKTKIVSCAKEVFDKVKSQGIKFGDNVIVNAEVIDRDDKQVEKVFDIAKA